MKTIYVKRKKSGNYEFSNREEATLKFRTQKSFKDWFHNVMRKESTSTWDRIHRKFKGAQLIKASYSQSQTYFFSADEALDYLKKIPAI